jgi:hypothetical protein
VTIIKLLTSHQDWYKDHGNTYDLISSLLHDNEVRDLLQINRHLDILWFNKEAFEGLLFWMILITAVKTSCDISIIQESREDMMEKAITLMAPLYEALENSQYQVEKLLEFLKVHSSSQESE